MDSFSETVNPNELFLLHVALVTVSHSNRKVTETVGSEVSKDSGHPQLALSASCWMRRELSMLLHLPATCCVHSAIMDSNPLEGQGILTQRKKSSFNSVHCF